ncbi:hypothetical protein [uncultured Pelagimonas sp.]|uniref:hypothetical protein n=1 Tax=uncultured Pelagimonas sp. TaxID=1618102 RepID=UPI00262C302A|nr:hypothetical protein [uncultured Pelagimonas sp.]
MARRTSHGAAISNGFPEIVAPVVTEATVDSDGIIRPSRNVIARDVLKLLSNDVFSLGNVEDFDTFLSASLSASPFSPDEKGQRHGEYLLYAVKPGCDWYRRIRKVYEGNEKQAEWLYVCEAGTGDSTIGNAQLFAETKYVNGLPTVKTQFYPNGHPAITTTFDSEGKRKITKSWSQDGTPTGCEQIDQDGKSGPCSD